MAPTVPKNPPLPEFDQGSGANRFAWIVANAPKVRAEREQASQQRWLGREIERRDRQKAEHE